jgi:hypothetical protein
MGTELCHGRWQMRFDLHDALFGLGVRGEKLGRTLAWQLRHALLHADRHLGIVPGLGGQDQSDAIRLRLLQATVGQQHPDLCPPV